MKNEKTVSEPMLLSIDESAEKLGMGRTWLLTQTEIPYVRIGRRKLFRPEDLQAFIEKNLRGKVG
jgi:excisionase family DNA binding protein